jgi:Domain of Unknown Function (DUF1080)
MHKILFATVAAGLLWSCNNNSEPTTGTKTDTGSAVSTTVAQVSSVTPLTDQEKTEGWQLLFDGTGKGWHKYRTGGPVDSAWITDSSLHLDASKMQGFQSKGGGDVVTDDEFENFDLKMEVKIDTGGNSGVMFYVHEGTDSAKYYYTFYTGPEMQVLDNARHSDAKIKKHRAGDLYDLISCSKESVKPALEWNQYEIKADKGKLDFYVNGVNVVSTTLWDANWKKLVAGSKFKQWPEFATFKKGRIALQDHGHNVWFKNIKIKKL